MKSATRPIVITTPNGLVPFLKKEVSAIGFPIDWSSENALGTRGTYDATMKLNLWLRMAHHVLYQLNVFRCSGLAALYHQVNAMPWETIIPVNGYVSVVATVDHPSIRDHRIVNLKCKDAIVDRIAEKKRRRPNSGSQKHGTVITAFWNKDRCTISIDTSGESLSKRGYRKIPLRAPMQETLAAGVVYATGYNGHETFINPMCGSGTCAIEAALIACNKAPGLTRDNYGFMHTQFFDEKKWQTLYNDAQKMSIQPGKRTMKIIATDNDEHVISAARKNAQAAGIEKMIHFSVCDFESTIIPEKAGVIFFNPEYGIRLGDEKELIDTYRAIGTFMKKRCQGYRGYIFTGNSTLAGKVGLKSGRKQKFKSGKIDCRLYEYRLYQGKG